MLVYITGTTTIGQRVDRMPRVAEPSLRGSLKGYSRNGQQENNTTTVVLFGRTQEGRSVVGSVTGVRPSMRFELPDDAHPWDVLDELLSTANERPIHIGRRDLVGGSSDGVHGVYGDVEVEQI